MKGYDIADYYIIKVLHMNIDFSKILKGTKSDDIEPRDIFMALPGKDKKYEYPRDVLSDKLHIVMQDSIYTWTEEQVLNKIPDIISEYRYLETLNDALGKTYHSIEEVRNDLANQFKFVCRHKPHSFPELH